MITAEHLVRKYPTEEGTFTALNDVSLTIPENSLTALLGPSGSGKSTLLRAIAGLDTPDEGRIIIDGKDVTGVPPQRRGIGFVFQHYAAFSHMTVRENIAFGLKLRKRPKAEIHRRVDELLEVVALTGFAERYPAQLSGGQRQRMALARALAVEPKVLLLDEPFGALDAKVRKDLRAWLRALHEEVPVTTVLVTHDQEEALDVADRIAVVNHGALEQCGSPAELYDRPANDFVMSFLGSTSVFKGQLVRPHDLLISRTGAGSDGASDDGAVHWNDDGFNEPAIVRRVVMLGFEVRVELEQVRQDTEQPVVVQVTRERARELALRPGDRVVLTASDYSI